MGILSTLLESNPLGLINSGVGAVTDIANTVVGAVQNKKQRQHEKALQEDAQSFNAEQAQLNRDFQSKEAELAFDRQLDYFEQTQSASAQVEQYKKAGLNPALLAGGISLGSSNAQSSPSGSTASSGISGSSMKSLPAISNVMDAFLNAKRKEAEIENIEADTAQKAKTTSWIDELNSSNVALAQSVIAKNEAETSKALQDVAESAKRMDLYDTQIKVGNAEIDLKGSQQVLNDCRSAFTKLQSEQLQAILPYAAAREEAEIAFTTAKTKTEKFKAEEQMYNANLAMLKVLVEQGLISDGYYEDVKDMAHWQTKYKKREYKWSPVNDICDNVSKVAIATAQVVGSITGVMGKSTPVVTTPPAMNFW